MGPPRYKLVYRPWNNPHYITHGPINHSYWVYFNQLSYHKSPLNSSWYLSSTTVFSATTPSCGYLRSKSPRHYVTGELAALIQCGASVFDRKQDFHELFCWLSWWTSFQLQFLYSLWIYVTYSLAMYFIRGVYKATNKTGRGWGWSSQIRLLSIPIHQPAADFH